VNMCSSLVEIRSMTSEIRHLKKERKKEEKTTAVKYNPFRIAMPGGLISISCTVRSKRDQ